MKMNNGDICADIDDNIVIASGENKFRTPVPIAGALLLSLGLKHDQRTGWFRWGENLEYGIRQTSNGWEAVKANSKDVRINLGKVFFIHEVQKIYNESNAK